MSGLTPPPGTRVFTTDSATMWIGEDRILRCTATEDHASLHLS